MARSEFHRMMAERKAFAARAHAMAMVGLKAEGMMGDMGELFREWDAFKKQAKEARHGQAQAIFFDAWQGPPMPGWTRHTPYHWSRELCGDRLDYWPSTGKWIWRKKRYHGTPYDTANFIAKRETALQEQPQ